MLRATALRPILLTAALTLAAVTPVHAAGENAAVKAQEAASALLRGNVEQAVAAYTDALADTTLPNDRRAAILNDRGVAYSRFGQSKQALDDYNRAVALFPEYAPIYNNRGNILLALGLPQEAIKDFDRAIALAPGYAAAYNNRGGAYLRLNQSQPASRDYTRAITLMPQNAAPLSGRGRALLDQDRPYAAIRDFARAISADARSGTAYQARAAALIDIDRFDEAIEDLSRAIAFEPNSLDLHVQRGHAYLEASNAASALRDFVRAVEIDGNSAKALAGRGYAHAHVEAYEEAEADLAKALEIDPRSVDAFIYRAWLYKQTGQPELGLKEVEKALRIDGKRADVHWVRGEVELALGRNDEAIASFKTALTLKPSHRQSRASLQALGVESDGRTEVAGAGIPSWRVMRQAGRYSAQLDGHTKLHVPLEMAGQGEPRLLSWELKDAPLKGIGLLRYYAGQSTMNGPQEEVEQIAIIDLASSQVVSMQMERQGDKQSTWTWNEGKVTIASVDGITEELELRAIRPQVAQQRRPVEQRGPSDPFRAPWNQGWGSPGYAQRSSGSGGQQQRRQQKPKTLFDMLFGN